MRKYGTWVGIVLLLTGCSQGLPRPGDAVAPRLTQPVNWTAGEKGELWVDLAATDASGIARRLSFAASPVENPIVTVTFYDGQGGLVGEEEVELSQRC